MNEPFYTIDKDKYLQFFRENWKSILDDANTNWLLIGQI